MENLLRSKIIDFEKIRGQNKMYAFFKEKSETYFKELLSINASGSELYVVERFYKKSLRNFITLMSSKSEAKQKFLEITDYLNNQFLYQGQKNADSYTNDVTISLIKMIFHLVNIMVDDSVNPDLSSKEWFLLLYFLKEDVYHNRFAVNVIGDKQVLNIFSSLITTLDEKCRIMNEIYDEILFEILAENEFVPENITRSQMKKFKLELLKGLQDYKTGRHKDKKQTVYYASSSKQQPPLFVATDSAIFDLASDETKQIISSACLAKIEEFEMSAEDLRDTKMYIKTAVDNFTDIVNGLHGTDKRQQFADILNYANNQFHFCSYDGYHTEEAEIMYVGMILYLSHAIIEYNFGELTYDEIMQFLFQTEMCIEYNPVYNDFAFDKNIREIMNSSPLSKMEKGEIFNITFETIIDDLIDKKVISNNFNSKDAAIVASHILKALSKNLDQAAKNSNKQSKVIIFSEKKKDIHE